MKPKQQKAFTLIELLVVIAIIGILSTLAVVSLQNARKSALNCIEEMKLEIDKSKMPKSDKIVIPVNLQLISLWMMDDFSKENTSDIKLELIDPKGKVLNEFFNTLKSRKGDKRLRSITNIQGIQVTESGRYFYRIFQKKENKFKIVSEAPLDINISFKTFNDK